MKLKQLIPMLKVSDIKASLDFYDKALGFKVVSEPKTIEEWRWASISSGETHLMLTESSSTLKSQETPDSAESDDWPCIYYFYPDNVEALYEHILDAGYSPTKLEVTFYGMKEFSIRDPNGHLLSFGEDTE